MTCTPFIVKGSSFPSFGHDLLLLLKKVGTAKKTLGCDRFALWKFKFTVYFNSLGYAPEADVMAFIPSPAALLWIQLVVKRLFLYYPNSEKSANPSKLHPFAFFVVMLHLFFIVSLPTVLEDQEKSMILR